MSIDAFIKIKDVDGESVVKGHEDEIDVLAWGWGMSNAGTTHTGKGAGGGKVNVQDLSFTHAVDSSTPNLMQACATGKHFDDAVMTLRKAGETPLDYIIITLTNVIVTSVSTGGSQGEESLTENITLNFSKYKYAYQPQSSSGGAEGGAIETEYDIALNE
jgi:type VI secretion system secreted protein Hcp